METGKAHIVSGRRFGRVSGLALSAAAGLAAAAAAGIAATIYDAAAPRRVPRARQRAHAVGRIYKDEWRLKVDPNHQGQRQQLRAFRRAQGGPGLVFDPYHKEWRTRAKDEPCAEYPAQVSDRFEGLF